jgi:hypothetical protein
MKVEARYRFIGEDGSLGYRHGRIYRLVLAVPGHGWPIEIIDGGQFCPYDSEEAFSRNWEPVGQFDEDGPMSRSRLKRLVSVSKDSATEENDG